MGLFEPVLRDTEWFCIASTTTLRMNNNMMELQDMSRFNTESWAYDMVAAGAGCMPALGFGTWQISGARCVKSVMEAIQTGYRHIDTAQAYGNERQVGRALGKSGVPREDIFLTTKIPRERLRTDSIKHACEASLQRLDTEYVDLLLIHWPNLSIPLAETLGAMAELVHAGKVCHVGVSNFPVRLLEEAVRVSPVPILTNQVEYHPYLSQEPVLSFCRRNDITLTAYSPLARGRVVKDPVLKEIGARYGKTPAQVALRWLIQQEGVAAIPKSSSPEHLKSNFELFDFSLNHDDMAQIFELTGECKRFITDPGRPDLAPEWDT